jgi:hypothetical protein
MAAMLAISQTALLLLAAIMPPGSRVPYGLFGVAVALSWSALILAKASTKPGG